MNGQAGFTPLGPAVTGVNFTNQVPPARHLTNQIYLNGSGVAAGDVDGDGWCDFLVCGLGGRSALFRNLGGWRFTNVTAGSGLALGHIDATGAALADLDGDGDLDLVVNSVGHGTFLYLNDGQGRFAFAPSNPVLNRRRGGMSMALADTDGDGTLDLYVANYRVDTVRDRPKQQFTVQTVNGEARPVAFGGRALTQPDLTNRFAFRFQAKAADGAGTMFHDELGESDAFFRNLGGGRFAPVQFAATFTDEKNLPLAAAPPDWGLSVMMRDFNGDGAPDIYVCNDFTSPDRFWLNDGRGRFRAAPPGTLRQTSLSSMGVDVADVDRDGHDDFLVVDMLASERWRRMVQQNESSPTLEFFVDPAHPAQVPRNTLQLARGGGGFAEVAQFAGVEASGWSWTPVFLDVDLDGFEDLLVSNGFERDFMNGDANRRLRELERQAGPKASEAQWLGLRRSYPRLATPNAAFRNLGGGRFAAAPEDWRFNTAAVGQGMCLADLDNDGDLDVLINNFNGPVDLLRNDGVAPRVAVRLKGRAPNTRGIGARIRLLGGAVPAQSQEMICGGRYLSSDEPVRVFAAGSLTNRMTIEVTWRNGTRSVVTNVSANRVYEISEEGARAAERVAVPHVAPLFREISASFPEPGGRGEFDDTARQPLLPRTLGKAGPGVAWFDMDGDGRDDLILPGSRGAVPAVLRNDGRGGFAPMVFPMPEAAAGQGLAAMIGWRPAGGEAALIAGVDRYQEPGNGVIAWQSGRAGREEWHSEISAPGAVAMADVDGDGALELFVAGRCEPGRWPEPASSRLFRRGATGWLVDTNNSQVLDRIGLVNGAVFSDLDGDGFPELVLGCDWGSVRILGNRQGRFTNWNPRVTGRELPADVTTLDQLTGWWTGVTAGDFDGDGRMDLLAGNWGRNTRHEALRTRPLRLYFGDINGDGGVGLIEAGHDAALGDYAPLRPVTTMAREFPWLLARYDSFEAFSRETVRGMLGERMAAARMVEARWLESAVFLNRGDHFEVRVLPMAAQLAPVFGVVTADFDGDGNEDAFLAQNFVNTRADPFRLDAGGGVILRGDGRGGFVAMSAAAGGIGPAGEQRGAAVADFDGDGRVDLAVARHGGTATLWRNEAARPGLRVRLRGPAGNADGAGVVVRLDFGGRLGPAREAHAGSGHWSQDSAVAVLAVPSQPVALWCRWPGGRTNSVPLPPAREVSLDESGRLEVLR